MDEVNGSNSDFKPPRDLSIAELNSLSSQKETLPQSKIVLLEKNAAKYWDIFYKNNTTNFFKDRHWLFREFEPLQELASDIIKERVNFFEIGCGVGNAFFPIMNEVHENVFGFACDFSKRAVNFVLENELFKSSRMTAFTCDVSKDSLSALLEKDIKIDICTLLFVLSALDPSSMKTAVENVGEVMKSGGKVCFRDYAVNDHAMVRFGPRNHKISDRFYVRQDNTRAYFFYLEELEQLFLSSGFKTEKIEYKESKTENREKNLSVDRYFVQAVFVRI